MDDVFFRPKPVRSVTVAAGDIAPFVLEMGEHATVADPEGMQKAGLFIFDSSGIGVPEIGCPLDPALRLADVLQLAPPSAASIHALIAAHPGASVANAVGYTLLAADGPPGQSIVLCAPTRLLCVVWATGEPMPPDGATHPPTGLRVSLPVGASDLPPPLAPVKHELRVLAATAAAYRVATGDYIQIMDVDGKQCSDFLAFDEAALGAGETWGIDATTTRTLLGQANPGPGLHSRYFDARMRPLIEVVRDTVGRHDAFMLACAAKYYEDMGYPGHANCTENFNRAVTPFGIAERAGWPAINFFYNTFVRPDGGIGMDEPWSRPGDYVLLRALTDLVCASSSCADDIDAANGWLPTDIQVRVYDKSHRLSQGSAHRMTPDAEPELTRETGFHPRTSALTRAMQDYKGFWLPTSFTAGGAIDEYWACRERAAIMDLSALRKFEVTGPDAEALLQLAVTRDIRKLAVGQVVYTAICHPHGGMLDDATVFRLAAQNFRLVCGDPYCGVWMRELAAARGFKVWVKTSTEQLHNVAVQGPRSREILAAIVRTAPHRPTILELGWFRFTIGRISDAAVLISRTGYTGELGYEVWCHPDDAVGVWDSICRAGQPFGMAPLGLAALDILRIEAGLAFAGHEFCDQTDPFEAGIGFAVPAGKPDPFIGDDALRERRAHPHRKLAGLNVDGNEAVGHGDPVFAGRAQIGVVTSATRSPILGKTIALARLDVSGSAIGRSVEIGKLDGHQKRLAATVTRFPHYDPEKARSRA